MGGGKVWDYASFALINVDNVFLVDYIVHSI